MKLRIYNLIQFFVLLGFFNVCFAQISVPYANDFETTSVGWVTWSIHSPTCNESRYIKCSDIEWQVLTNPQTYRVANDIYPDRVDLPEEIGGSTHAYLPSAHSGRKAWWCGSVDNATFAGDDYVNPGYDDDGVESHNWMRAALRTPLFNTSSLSSIYMSFWTWWEVECIDIYKYDLMEVLISINNGGSWSVLDTLNPPFSRLSYWRQDQSFSTGGYMKHGEWVFWAFDLSRYIGNNLMFEFRFDTRDNLYNGFRGWMIDDFYIGSGPKYGKLNWELNSDRIIMHHCERMPNPYNLDIDVWNSGRAVVNDVSVRLEPLPEGLFLVSGTTYVSMGALSLGDTASCRWQIGYTDSAIGIKCAKVIIASADSEINYFDDFENPTTGIFEPTDSGIFDYTSYANIRRIDSAPSGLGFAGIPSARGGIYEEGKEYTFTTKPIYIGGFPELYISYYYWANFRDHTAFIEGYDGVVLEIRVDYGEWKQVDQFATGVIFPPYTGYITVDVSNPLEMKLCYCKDTRDWMYTKTADLKRLGFVTEGDSLRVRFRFGSAILTTDPDTMNGFYIDDFQIASSSSPMGPFWLNSCVTLPYLGGIDVTAYYNTVLCEHTATIISAVVTTPGQPYTVEWTPRDKVLHYSGISTWAFPNTTTYFKVKATNNSSGCEAVDSILLRVDKLDIEAFGSTRVCEGDIVNLFCSISDGIYPITIKWFERDPDTDIVEEIHDGDSLTIEAESSRWFYCFVVDSARCTKEDSIYIRVSPLPGMSALILPAEDDTISFDESLLFWENAAYTENYTLIVNAETLAVLDSNSFFLEDVDCNASYEWRVISHNHCGDTESPMWHFRIRSCGEPIIKIIEPYIDTWTACEDQQIFVTLTDSDGVNDSSIVLNVNSIRYTVDDSTLKFENDTLTFTPIFLWTDNETVTVCIESVADSFGNALDIPECWNFIVDLSPPVIGIYEPDSVISPIEENLRIVVLDLLSGVDTTTVEISIEHLGGSGVYYSSDIVFSGDTLIIPVDTVDFIRGDTVNIYVTVGDSPEYCGPNYLDSCLRTPVGECMLFVGICSGLYACPGESVLLGELIVLGGATPPLGFRWFDEHGTLISTDPSPTVLIDSTTSFKVYVNDAMGCTSWVNIPVGCMFNPSDYIELIYPTPELTIRAGSTTVYWHSPGRSEPIYYTITVNDSIMASEITDTQFTFLTVCEDTYSWYVEGYNICYHRQPHCTLGYTDTNEVYYYSDTAIFIGSTREPIFFTAPCHGPMASIIRPEPETWSRCLPDSIIVEITSLATIVETTIVLEVDGVNYTVLSSYLTWVDPILVFHPTVFEDGDTVRICLRSAIDEWGGLLEVDSLCWVYFIDRSPPVILSTTFSASDTIASKHPEINFEIFDSLSGVDFFTITLDIGHWSFRTGDPCLNISLLPSGHVGIDVDSTCISFSACDTATVRLTVSDSTQYCGPNILDTTWVMVTDCDPPEARPIWIPPDLWYSCEDDSIVIWLYDGLAGVDTVRIILIVEDDTITWGDPGLSYKNDTLVYKPPTPFPESGTINVRLYAIDFVDNELIPPLEWFIKVDKVPPRILDFDPDCGDTIPYISPEVSILFMDDGCGVILDSVSVSLNDTLVFYYHDGSIDLSGGRLIFDCSDTGIRFENGDSVNICWHLVDCAGDICPNNVLDTCCMIYIVGNGPQVAINHPSEVWVSCPDDSIRFIVSDENGIIMNSIIIEVCRKPDCSTCITYTMADPQIHSIEEFDDSVTFWFVPTVLFEDKDTICIHAVEVSDSITNPMQSTDSIVLYMDISTPVMLNSSPEVGDTVLDSQPEICIELIDSLSGIDGTLFNVTIDTFEFVSGSSALSWDGNSLCVSTTDTGIYWLGGDTVIVCVKAYDSPDVCPPNELDSCFKFYMENSSPIAIPIRPDIFVISACPNDSVIFEVIDPQDQGIIDSSLVVTLEGNRRTLETLRVGEFAGLVWHSADNKLALHPEPQFDDGETLTVCVIEAKDTIGNALDIPVCITFVIDLSSFLLWDLNPADDESVRTTTPVISMLIEDVISGIDDSSIMLSIEGNRFRLSDLGLTKIDSLSKLIFDSEAAGLAWNGGYCVYCTLFAYDSPTPGFCEPNDSSVAFYFCIAAGGPIGQIVYPENGTRTACNDQVIAILFSDPDGLNLNSVVITVNDEMYSIEDGELSYLGDTVFYEPLSPFADAETVHVCLIHALDNLGNDLSSLDCWWFIVDLSPPEFGMIIPPNATMVRSSVQSVLISTIDRLSGIDTSSIVMEVYGGERDVIINPSDSGWTVEFSPGDASIVYASGDTVWINIYACDMPDYCDANCGEAIYWFWVLPYTACTAEPNPFTPNADGINDITIFNFPEMFGKSATIEIYNIQGSLVYEGSIGNVYSYEDYSKISWNGFDNDDNPLPIGLYVYLIIRNGEIVCKGSVVIAR